MKKTKLKKQDEEMEEKDEEMMDEEEEKGNMKYSEKACKKSEDLTVTDLQKSINRLASYASEETMSNRKNELLEKAQSGDELTKSEQEELFQLIGGKVEEEETATLAKSITENLTENEGLQKALDVSEYLQEQHTELVKSLGSIADHVEASDSRQHEFNLVLAKAVADVGNLVKGLAEKFDVYGSQPAHAPKSRGINAPLQKSFAGAPGGEQMSKSDILNVMEAMHEESLQKGEDGRLENGEDILNAIAKYESFNQVSRPMLAAVEAFRSRSAH